MGASIPLASCIQPLQINPLASQATLQGTRLSGVLKSLRLTNDIQRRPITHLSRAVRDT